MTFDRVPVEMRALPQWCLWKTITRHGKPTKVPYQVNGDEAESNNPETWCPFEDAQDAFDRGGYDGIGFMLACGYVGVDLDGCRNTETGKAADWAKEIVLKLDSYTEVSPSGTGFKIFLRGKSPFLTGKNLKLPNNGSSGEKEAGIEVYDHGRYFAVTGIRLQGATECNERQAELDWLKDKYWPNAVANVKDFYGDDSVMERARKYLTKCPPAVSGNNGSGSAFHVACILVLGFGLSRETSLMLFREWNQTCQPPWSEAEIEHKIDDAAKQTGPRNYLRNITPQKWPTVSIPTYSAPRPVAKQVLHKTTMTEAVEKYIKLLEDGGGHTISLGIPELDRSLGGGVEAGEFMLLAARPSHGKSMLAMQFAHYWSTIQMPSLFISEEMPAITLGKRALQFITDYKQSDWRGAPDALRADLAAYAKSRECCHIIENCGSVETATAQIEEAIEKHGIKVAIVDYVQCLKSKGKDKIEQVSNASTALRQLAHDKKILVIALSHLNRNIEGRKTFIPVMADLKDSGQLEQDADVILFLVWPWRLDNRQKPNVFQIFIAKNRNRGIMEPCVVCDFDPIRQKVAGVKPENYEYDFDTLQPTEPWGNDNDDF